MDIGVLYAVVAGIGMLVVGVVYNRIVATKHKETIDRPLCRLLKFFMLFSAVDMLWGFFMSEVMWVNLTGYIAFTYAFHLFAAFSAFFWAGYALNYMSLPRRPLMLLNSVRFILLGVQLYIIVSNIWNCRFFEITDDYRYISYSMRTVNFIIQFSYYILLIISASVASRTRTDERLRIKSREVVAFSVIPLAFGIGQVAWPDAPMYSLGFMVTSVLIYSFNVTKYREEYLSRTWKEENDKLMLIASGLSEDFIALFCVDLDTGEYEKYSNSTFTEKREGRGYTEGHDFFGKMASDNIMNQVVAEDRATVLDMLSLDHIQDELQTKRSFSFNCRTVIGSGNSRYSMIKVICPSTMRVDNKIIVGIFDDDERVHDEMEKAEELRIAMEKAESASRAKTSFLFSMSHDVRTPMNAIIGFTDIAKKNINNRERVAECLDKVSTSSQHLLSLISDVLSMSRLEAGKFETSEIANTIPRIVTQIVSIINGRAVENDIKLIYDYINLRDEYVMCNLTHINQIMINLLSNAIKYTPAGGRVKFTVEQLDDKDGLGTYLFSVADNGIGMSQEFLDHIFDEFAREQSATLSGVEGTGLGMSIVKKLVGSLGGDIRVESTQNVGTTVYCTLYFKRCTKEDVESNDEIESRSEDELDLIKGHHILLVDDNELNREIAGDMLRDMEIDIDEACDGLDALEKLQAREPGYYSMILMDVQMPRMDGYAATRVIRALENEKLASVPIVAMTANAFDEDKRNAFAAGMNDHIVKPIDPSKVRNTLIKYISE